MGGYDWFRECGGGYSRLLPPAGGGSSSSDVDVYRPKPERTLQSNH